MSRVAVVLCLLTVGAFGCAERVRPERPSPPALDPAVLVDYRRAGGLAPRRDHLVVRRGRRAVLRGDSGRRRFRVGRGELSRLRAALERADLARLERDQPEPDRLDIPPQDAINYQVIYDGHRVSFDQTQVPKPIEAALVRLDALVDARRGKGP